METTVRIVEVYVRYVNFTSAGITCDSSESIKSGCILICVI